MWAYRNWNSIIAILSALTHLYFLYADIIILALHYCILYTLMLLRSNTTRSGWSKTGSMDNKSQKVTLLLRIKFLHTTHTHIHIHIRRRRATFCISLYVTFNHGTVNIALPNSTTSRGPPTWKTVLIACVLFVLRSSRANIISPSHSISRVQRWLESFVCIDGILWVGDYVTEQLHTNGLQSPPLELDQWCIRRLCTFWRTLPESWVNATPVVLILRYSL